MDYLIFEWDENKNRNNLAKHGISFDEAKTVFLDDNAVHWGRTVFDSWKNISGKALHRLPLLP